MQIPSKEELATLAEGSSLHDAPNTRNYKLYSELGPNQKVYDFKGKIFGRDITLLYEMVHYCEGDILELGCFHGLSTLVMANAILGSPNPNRKITTIDISEHATGVARQTFLRHGVNDLIEIRCSDAAVGLKALKNENKRFKFAFIDHDHGYEAVKSACEELLAVLEPESYCFFHDFQDARNWKGEYGVYQAIKDTIADKLDFIGLYGQGGLFKILP